MKTNDGKEYSVHKEYAKGHVENPVTDKELEEKFRNISNKVLNDKKAGQVIEMVWKLDELKDINRLIDLVRG